MVCRSLRPTEYEGSICDFVCVLGKGNQSYCVGNCLDPTRMKCVLYTVAFGCKSEYRVAITIVPFVHVPPVVAELYSLYSFLDYECDCSQIVWCTIRSIGP